MSEPTTLATNCPDENTLARFALGREHANLPALEAHLDACESCRRAVAAAASEHTLPTAPHGPELGPGHRVGRYEIERELGRGGMGVVYQARDVTLDRRVALKLLHARRDEAAQARLLREAQVMAKLAHPNVVPVFELGELRGDVFLVMELVAGTTLDAWLKASKHSQREILARFVEAGRGLAAAHAAGVVHRDFKPANVLVGADGRVRVTDFGLSRPGPAVALPPLGSPLVTREGTVIGTLAYMAPEQLDGSAATEASDQFAFCMALAEALSGVRPFDGANWSTLAVSHSGRPALKSAIPARLRSVLRRGLEKDPSRRYASMTALLNAFERAHRPGWTPVAVTALAGAALTFLLALVATSRPAPSKAAEALAKMRYVPVVMAARDLQEGTVLTMDMVYQREVPDLYVTDSVIAPDSISYVINQQLKVPLNKGDMLLWTAFETEGTVPVLVAARDLPAGTKVTADMLTTRDVRSSSTTPSQVLAEAEQAVVGEALVVAVPAGDAIQWNYFKAGAQKRPKKATSRVSSEGLEGDIADVISAHLDEVETCVMAQRKTGAQSGRVEVAFGIDGEGKPVNVELSSNDVAPNALIRSCVSEKVEQWRFARKARARIVLPIVF